MKPIEEIISSLRIAMTDARQNESHFESWMILNEAICDAIDALAEQPAQQEPVAWLIAYEVCCGKKNRGSSLKKFDEVWAKCSFVSEDKDAEINASKWRNRKETPLYTSPPIEATPLASQRSVKPWVGLTDEEIYKMPAWIYSPDQDGMTAEEGLEVFARAIEAKLREKNT